MISLILLRFLLAVMFDIDGYKMTDDVDQDNKNAATGELLDDDLKGSLGGEASELENGK
jgi:hypothetical protein